MFHFFRKKTPFEQYYEKFISQPVMQRCPLHKPITAAYLYILSDYFHRASPRRNEVAQKIFNCLEKRYLSEDELATFDYTTGLFARVLNDEISPRGDWCFHDGDTSTPLGSLFICYGDLIFDFDLLNEYTNFTYPVTIRPIDVHMKFMLSFRKLAVLISQYQLAITQQ